MKAWWWGAMTLGCTPVVDLGEQRAIGPATMCVEQVVLDPCPVASFMPMPSPSSLEPLRGRWRLCGGARHQPDGTRLTTFHGTTVIELEVSQTSAGVAFFERHADGALTRSLEHQARYDASTGRLTITSSEGDEASFKVASTTSPKMMRLSSLDQWDFVPIE